jgi:O-antigen ligase
VGLEFVIKQGSAVYTTRYTHIHMAVAGYSSSISRLRALEIKTLWRRTFKQSPAFLLTAAYVFLEYVRPTGIYPALQVLPWARIALVGALIACLLERRSSFSNVRAWGLIGLFTLVILASSVQAVYPSLSFENLNLWLSWLCVIFIISSVADTEERFLLLLVGFLLWNVKMSQHGVRSWASAGFTFRSWGIAGPPGWFENSGELAIEMCVFFPIVVYLLVGLRPHLSLAKQLVLAAVAASAVVTTVGSSSRGGLLGLAAVALVMLLLSPKRLTGLFYIVMAALLAWVLLPSEQRMRFQSAGEDGTSLSRLTYWADGVEIANNYPILGIGYKNWPIYYKFNFGGNGTLPHNIFIEAWAEMGYLGLVAFLLLIAYVFYENWQTRRLTRHKGPNPNRFVFYMAFGLDGALIGYLVSGFFVTVLFYPFFWVNLAFVIALARVARNPVSQASMPRQSADNPGPGGMVTHIGRQPGVALTATRRRAGG